MLFFGCYLAAGGMLALSLPPINKLSKNQAVITVARSLL